MTTPTQPPKEIWAQHTTKEWNAEKCIWYNIKFNECDKYLLASSVETELEELRKLKQFVSLEREVRETDRDLSLRGSISRAMNAAKKLSNPLYEHDIAQIVAALIKAREQK